MNIKMVAITLVIAVLIITQFLTYFFIGPSLLKNKLLTFYVPSMCNCDTAYVRDFYLSDCGNNSGGTHLSLKLEDDKNEIAEKLNVSSIFFIKNEPDLILDTVVNLKLRYDTWFTRGPWFTLFNGFNATQTEVVFCGRYSRYEKRCSYTWLFLFWIKTYELNTTVANSNNEGFKPPYL